MKQQGYTLIELLLVIAIVATLGALLFPVFASVREQGRHLSCISNLHQIGLAVDLYTQDSDDIVPFGGDPIDINTKAWKYSKGGIYWQQAQELHPLPEVLAPYISDKHIWRCPSDSGFDEPDYSGGATFPASPSAFEQYGCSYDYRTELAFRQMSLNELVAYDPNSPYTEHGTSEVDLMFDLSGMWHGGFAPKDEKFNVLMCDGHIKTLTDDQMDDMQGLTLDKPVP